MSVSLSGKQLTFTAGDGRLLRLLFETTADKLLWRHTASHGQLPDLSMLTTTKYARYINFIPQQFDAVGHGPETHGEGWRHYFCTWPREFILVITHGRRSSPSHAVLPRPSSSQPASVLHAFRRKLKNLRRIWNHSEVQRVHSISTATAITTTSYPSAR